MRFIWSQSRRKMWFIGTLHHGAVIRGGLPDYSGYDWVVVSPASCVWGRGAVCPIQIGVDRGSFQANPCPYLQVVCVLQISTRHGQVGFVSVSVSWRITSKQGLTCKFFLLRVFIAIRWAFRPVRGVTDIQTLYCHNAWANCYINFSYTPDF